MMKKLFNFKAACAGICILSAGVLPARAQIFDWVLGMGGLKPDWAMATVVDQADNVYVTGYFGGTAEFTFGGGALTAAGDGQDAFLAKFDPAGNLIWVKGFGGSNNDAGMSVAVDPVTADVLVTGTIGAGTAEFNPNGTDGTVTSAGSNDVFLARFDSAGNFIWVKCFGGTGAENATSVTVDAQGSILITGDFRSPVAYFNPGVTGSGELTITGSTSKPNADGYIAKYDGNGNFQWAHKMGGSGPDYCGQAATDATGNVYAIGWFNSTGAQFDATGNPGSQLTTSGGYDAYLVKYDPSGALIWLQKMGGTGSDHGIALALDRDNNIYITGYFASATADFDPAAPGGAGMLTLHSDIDLYIAKYDTDGAFVWAKSMGGDKKEHAHGIALDGAANIYITGSAGSSYIDFNPGATGGTVLNVANYCIFLAKYDSSGKFVFARGMGGVAGEDWGRGVDVDRHGNVYTTGYFSSHVAEFNRGGTGGVLEGNDNNYDIFLLKLVCNDTSSSYMQILACGDQYILNDSIYTASGNYTQYFVNRTGCDSMIRLELNFYTLNPTIQPEGYTLYVTESFATYQWMQGTRDIPGATDSFYTVTENDEYYVRVSDDRGCETISGVYRVNNVGIEYAEDPAGRISIYPNPAKDRVHISSPVTVRAYLSSLDGRMVTEETTSGVLTLEQTVPGVYILQILDMQGRMLKAEKLTVH